MSKIYGKLLHQKVATTIPIFGGKKPPLILVAYSRILDWVLIIEA